MPRSYVACVAFNYNELAPAPHYYPLPFPQVMDRMAANDKDLADAKQLEQVCERNLQQADVVRAQTLQHALNVGQGREGGWGVQCGCDAKQFIMQQALDVGRGRAGC